MILQKGIISTMQLFWMMGCHKTSALSKPMVTLYLEAFVAIWWLFGQTICENTDFQSHQHGSRYVDVKTDITNLF